MNTEQYRRIIDQASYGYAHGRVILDDHNALSGYEILEVNPAFEKMTGMKVPDMANRRLILDYAEVASNDIFAMQHCGEVAIKGEDATFDYFITTLKKWFTVQVWSPGKYFFVVTYSPIDRSVDIPEQDSLFKGIIENNPMAIHVVDKDGFTFITNAAHTRLFGATPPPGYSIFNDPQIESLGLNPLMQTIRQGNVVEFPDFIYNAHKVNPDFPDKPVWIRLVIFPHRGKDNFPEKYVLIHEDITSRKKAEEALCKSEESLTITLKSIGDAVMATDSHGRVTRMNTVAEELTGWISAEAKGRPLTEVFCIINAQTRATVENPVAKVLEDGIVVGLANHTLLISKTSKEFQIADSAAPIRNANGNIDGVVLVFRDVTKEYAIVDALRESEERYRTLFAHAPLGILHFDVDSTIRDVNNEFIKIIGSSRKALVGMNMFKQLNDDRLIAAIRSALNGETGHYKGAYHSVTANKVTPVSGLFVSFPGDDGKIIGGIGIFEDITERLQAEEYLQTAKQSYFDIFNTVSEAIYIQEETGTFIDVNKGAEKMYGFTNEELIGQSPGTVAAPGRNNLEQIRQLSREVFEKGIPARFDFWAKRKNGDIFLKEVIQNKGRYFGKEVLIATARDITEKRRSEERMIKLTNCLLGFGSDMNVNINNLVALCGETLGAVCALYNRMDSGMLCSLGQWQTPPGYQTVDNPDGHICYDVIRRNSDEPLVVRNLHLTDYLQSDPNVAAYKLVTYAGVAVKYRKQPIGSLCVVYQTDVEPLREELDFMSIIGFAIAIEEERKLAEKALRESESQKAAILRAIPDLLFVFNQNGDYLDIYTEDDTKLILPREILTGKNLRDLFPADVTEQAIDAFHQSVVTKELVHFSYSININGRTEYYEARIVPTSEDKVLAIVRDITQRKKAEQQIALLGKSIEQSPVSIVITDSSGNIEYVNPKFTEITGYHLSEAMGQNPRILKSGRQSAEVYKELWQTIVSGKQWFGELHNIKKNGELYWESVCISPILNDNGKVTHFVAVKEDITKMKQMVEEVIKAKEKAEENDHLKSAFLANMSHEIRTPMNGILGFAGLLKEPTLTGEDQQKYIQIIEKSGARMLNIINDIVDISKIESGQMEVLISKTNINGQTEYIYAFFKHEVECKGMQISYKNALPSKESIIKTDREKIYAILTNLVKNAIKYTNEGIIEFGYDLVQTPHVASLQFFVKDTGIGIAKDRQDAIFERFIQADISDKQALQGAGLGLSITKAYVEMLGGKIWVESELGKGSAFYFTIPYNHVTEEQSYNTNIGSKNIEENLIKRLKILIVEDDITSDLLITRMLKKISLEVFHSKTGIEAIETFRNHPDIDLILMDIKMPEMNGYEVTRQLRQFNKEVVIIAQTAYGLSGDREKAIEAGCSDYLSKPLEKAELMDMIFRYFAGTDKSCIAPTCSNTASSPDRHR